MENLNTSMSDQSPCTKSHHEILIRSVLVYHQVNIVETMVALSLTVIIVLNIVHCSYNLNKFKFYLSIRNIFLIWQEETIFVGYVKSKIQTYIQEENFKGFYFVVPKAELWTIPCIKFVIFFSLKLNFFKHSSIWLSCVYPKIYIW